MSSIVCPFCKAENRSNAKFCLACAKQMVDLETGELLSVGSRRKRRSSRPSKGASSRRTSKANITLAGGALLLLVLGAWFAIGNSEDAKESPSETQPAITQAADASATPQPASSALESPIQSSLGPAESLVSTEAETDVPNVMDRQAEPVQPAPNKAAKEAKASGKTSPPKQAPTDAAGSRVNQSAQEITISEPLPPPAPAASARTQTAQSPEQACQGTAFFNKAYCLQKQCASQPSHPQCKKLAETQAAMREGSGGG